MPEIKHNPPQTVPPITRSAASASTPPQSVSEEAADRMQVAAKTTVTPLGEPQIDEELEAQIEAILNKRIAKTETQVSKVEPDWKTLTEAQALNLNNPIYIPAIEHDIPEYLTVELEDKEYEVVWVNRDQRRVSYHQAQGYEFLEKSHVAKGFRAPLKFDSEGYYIFEDLIAMRVHKRILYGKRRRVLEISRLQLKGAERGKLPSTRQATAVEDNGLEDMSLGISDLPLGEVGFGKDRMGFYTPK